MYEELRKAVCKANIDSKRQGLVIYESMAKMLIMDKSKEDCRFRVFRNLYSLLHR